MESRSRTFVLFTPYLRTSSTPWSRYILLATSILEQNNSFLKPRAAQISDEITYPRGLSLKDVLAWGTTGLVVVHKPSKTVIKTPLHEDCSDLILREREIYERFTQLGGHQGILCYHGTLKSGIRLEYAPKGSLRSFDN